jgi:hypothetical protein
MFMQMNRMGDGGHGEGRGRWLVDVREGVKRCQLGPEGNGQVSPVGGR